MSYLILFLVIVRAWVNNVFAFITQKLFMSAKKDFVKFDYILKCQKFLFEVIIFRLKRTSLHLEF